jgi:hypothetical protein
MEYVLALDFEQQPDYKHLKGLFRELFQKMDYTLSQVRKPR